ncbi:MAG: type II toxin-antitoxin system PrlF family antitoxin [Chitinophagaceae bacterium]|nr:type II toxin-antitoxin system PrlF family antitoxin [Polaromonas sp.]
MSYALTVKSQVTVPKAIRQHLHVLPGQAIDYEPMPDGSVRMTAASKTLDDNPFLALVGIGVRRQPTEEIMRETRGEDSMR